LEFYKLDPLHLIVVYDDTTLALGKLRIRRKGSDGGHNGIKSILYQTGSDQFPRVKIGIGERPNPNYDLADWVLSKYSDAELKVLNTAFDNTVSAIELIMSGKIEEAMAKYN
jgi:PTH1 family peptidyl-tRNA hydrolase